MHTSSHNLTGEEVGQDLLSAPDSPREVAAQLDLSRALAAKLGLNPLELDLLFPVAYVG